MRIGTSLTLLAIGAILAFATSFDPTPMAGMTIEWNVIGIILMLIGIVGLIWSMMVMNRVNTASHTTTVVDDRPNVVERDTYVER